MRVALHYEQGTLTFASEPGEWIAAMPGFRLDARTKSWRASAHSYRDIIVHAVQHKIPLLDEARQYKALPLTLQHPIVPRDHQRAALAAWRENQSRGVVSLPTGAGKTILAVLAMAAIQRPTLVVVPTIDLLLQWQGILKHFFGGRIGALGGGVRELEDITVATYDSAHIMIETIGNRFGLLIFDECHHLPATQYQMIARGAIAPFRLGLSATVERTDGREELIYELIGELCYAGQIRDMVENVLAPYDVVSVQVPLTAQESLAYQEARGIYTNFVRRHRIDFSAPEGWQDFIRKSATLPGGKEAMDAYRDQKRLAQGAEGKLDELWRILQKHREERTIVFTQDNSMAYQIGRAMVLPVLTHQTKPKERKLFLEAFREGHLNVLVTSKVLNEGVDVPEASVGVVISGSGTVREHVQRLGRILRHQEGKHAVLYEIISKDTSEYYVNKRRRNHHAYQRPTQIQHTRG